MSLELKKVTVRFLGLTAVDAVSLTIPEKGIFSIIGPNGAGKTTIFNAVTGVHAPTAGAICFRTRELKKDFTVRTALKLFILALLFGVMAVTIVNAQTFWERTIVANYVYQQPFSWRAAVKGLRLTLETLSFRDGLLAFLVGSMLGLFSGYAIWKGSCITPELALRRGIARTFQNIRLFHQMSVIENVLVGMTSTLKSGIIGSAFRSPRHFREHRQSRDEAMRLLSFVGLERFAHRPAANLCYGDQRRLEIARALASKPSMLLLDEPAAGMNPTESVALMELIRKIRDIGVGVVLIEHHMNVVMGVSDEIAVLDYGNLIARGTPEEIRANPKVIQAYLGSEM